MNEQFEADGKMWWLVMKLGSLRHKFSPSRLTLLSYHHAGATPLMFSILSGSFGVVPLLLAGGARLDVRNSRKQTPLDLAKIVRAPSALLQMKQAQSSLEDPGVPTPEDTFFI